MLAPLPHHASLRSPLAPRPPLAYARAHTQTRTRTPQARTNTCAQVILRMPGLAALLLNLMAVYAQASCDE